MTDRWEYMSVIWSHSAIQVSKDPYVYEWTQDLYVWHPGASEAERRPQWSSKDSTVTGPTELDVLNELGAEGWELVSRETLDSVVMETLGGWPTGGRPVRSRATLKRRVGN